MFWNCEDFIIFIILVEIKCDTCMNGIKDPCSILLVCVLVFCLFAYTS